MENEALLDTENTMLSADNENLSMQSRVKLLETMDKCEKKMYDHGDIRETLVNRLVYISAAVLAAVTLINMILFFAGYYMIYLAAINIIVLAVFVYTLINPGYKKALTAYSQPADGSGGVSAKEAEEDFSEGAVFIHVSSVICIGKRFILISSGKEYSVLNLDKIIWAYAERSFTYRYMYGQRTGADEVYSVSFFTDCGKKYSARCQSGACCIIMDLLAACGKEIILGWSDDISLAYAYSPKELKENIKEIKLPHPYTARFE